MDKVTSTVAAQYAAYAYPEPFVDLDVKIAAGYADCGDPSHFGPMFWPEGSPQRPLRILVAGCGTVQASAIAYNNRQATVTGIDISETSLGHQRLLRDRFELNNLELYQGDLREVSKVGGQFDLIVSTGVLHHMENPSEGLAALGRVLAPGGAMFVMVYGRRGREGVYLLQDAFRSVGLTQSKEDVELVRNVLAALSPRHPASTYVAAASDLRHDPNGAALVDTFLHPQDRAYTVPEILEWVEGAGLGFQTWLENAFYYPDAFVHPALGERIKALPTTDQWAVVEKVIGFSPTHSFILRHLKDVHQVSFESDLWLGYRPYRFPDANLHSEDGAYWAQRFDVRYPLQEAQAAMFSLSDGTLTIAQAMAHPAFATFPPDEVHSFAKANFSQMWRLGLMMFQV